MNGGSDTGSTSTTSKTPTFGSTSTTTSAEGDVTVSKCDTNGNSIGMADIAVRIINSMSRVQSYWVTVSVNDAAGNRLTEANGASNSVRPGQSATAKLLASTGRWGGLGTVANVSLIPQ
jgi:hypothetical protein